MVGVRQNGRSLRAARWGRAAGLLPLGTFADLCTLPTSYESPPFTLGMKHTSRS